MKLVVSSIIILLAVLVKAQKDTPYGSVIENLFEVANFTHSNVKFDPMHPDRFILGATNGIHSVNPKTNEINLIYNSSRAIHDIMFTNKNDFYLASYSCIMHGTRSTLTGTFTAKLLAGDCDHRTYANGAFLESRFNLIRRVKPYGENRLLVLDRKTGRLRVADLVVGNMTQYFLIPGWCMDFTDDPWSNHHVYLLNKHMVVRYDMRYGSHRVVAGTGQEANAGGSGGEARFAYPKSLVILNSRDMIVIDSINKEIKLVQDYHTSTAVVTLLCQTEELEACPDLMVLTAQMALLGMNGLYVINDQQLHYIPHRPPKESDEDNEYRNLCDAAEPSNVKMRRPPDGSDRPRRDDSHPYLVSYIVDRTSNPSSPLSQIEENSESQSEALYADPLEVRQDQTVPEYDQADDTYPPDPRVSLIENDLYSPAD